MWFKANHSGIVDSGNFYLRYGRYQTIGQPTKVMISCTLSFSDGCLLEEFWHLKNLSIRHLDSNESKRRRSHTRVREEEVIGAVLSAQESFLVLSSAC
jgi:hypothetical protein